MKYIQNLTYTYLLLLFLTQQANGVEIVRLQLDYNGKTENMDIELFDDVAPSTVANYLEYVTTNSVTTITDPDGNEVCSVDKPKYDGTFIYRNVPGFVLQTGGFTFRPCDPTIDYLLHPAVDPPEGFVPLRFVQNATLSPVINEFNLSNVRGTLSMALLGDQAGNVLVDSGTTEWFINLNDNIELDDDKFTVFGSIIDNGMDVADEISGLPARPFADIAIQNLLLQAFGINIGLATFAGFPVSIHYDSSTFPLPPVLQEHLVIITTVRQINRPILRSSPAHAKFSLNVINVPAPVISTTVKNTSNESLTIGTINLADVSLPFSIISENCTGQTLAPFLSNPAAVCSISYNFTAPSVTTFSDSLNIDYTSDTDGKNYSVRIDLTGEGIPSTPVLIAPETAINFDDTIINSSSDEVIITVLNKGGTNLIFSPSAITGANNTDFAITNNSCDINNISTGATCEIAFTFTPLATDGEKSAFLSIRSNGGDADIPLTGTATSPTISTNPTETIIAQVGFSAFGFHKITNIGSGVLELTNATISGPDAAMFTQENECPVTFNTADSSAPLTTDNSCLFKITFTPIDTSPRSAVLTIESNDPDTPSIEVELIGGIDVPELTVVSSFDVGTSQINGISSTKALVLTNTGETPLLIENITGLNATSFSYTTNCINNNVSLEILPGFTCNIWITFTTSISGADSTILTLESNDPNNSIVTIVLNGFGDNDSDGVLSSVEVAAPNSGDGNNDDISDNIQNAVASLLDGNGDYITFVSDNSLALGVPTALADIALTSISTNLPTNVLFNSGIFSYSINLPIVPNGTEGADVSIFLEPDRIPTSLYKYGPTPDDTTPHWYNFSYDADTQTGAEFFGNVTVRSASGEEVKKSWVRIRYIDGSRGDDDLQINGIVISNSVALDFTPVSPDSNKGSGSLSYPFLMLFAALSLYRRNLPVPSSEDKS